MPVEHDIDLSTAKPIAFAPAMVAAIRAGRKTQTRRPAKFGDVSGDVPNVVVEPYPGEWVAWWTRMTPEEALKFSREQYAPGDGVHCPYGKPGDLLYVKERWRYECEPIEDYYGVRYQSDNAFVPAPDVATADRIADLITGVGRCTRWNTHLPKWAARTFLRIESIRVERLQEITPEDAIAEGVDTNPAKYAAKIDGKPAEVGFVSPTYAYGVLWNSHNRADAYTWAANPWVWVLTFSLINREVQHAG